MSKHRYGLQIIVATSLFFSLCQVCLATSVDESPEIKTLFFEGEVEILAIYDHLTRFYVVGTAGTVLDVRNDMYLRMTENLHNPPESFKIITPLTAVNRIAGEIPSGLLHRYTLQYYLELRERYEKRFIAKEPFSVRKSVMSAIDVDRIWHLDKDEWTDYARSVTHLEGWRTQHFPDETGTMVMFFDSNSSMGLAIKPVYPDDGRLPEKIIVDNYYPRGTLPQFTDTFRRKLERDETADLGPEYSVTITHTPWRLIEVIKMIITPKE